MGITPDRFTLIPRAARPARGSDWPCSWPFRVARRRRLPQDLYERAQPRSALPSLRREPAPDALRKVAQLYEAIVLRYPASGYSDNALWQAAGLLQRTFEISGEAKDRERRRTIAGLAEARVSAQRPGQAGRCPRRRPRRCRPHRRPPRRRSGASGCGDRRRKTVGDGPRSRSATSRSHPLPRGDRVTIELSEEVAFTGERVANPDRIFFDFTNSAIAASIAERARGRSRAR